MESIQVIEVIEQAFARSGTPEIVSNNQGSRFAADARTDAVLAEREIPDDAASIGFGHVIRILSCTPS